MGTDRTRASLQAERLELLDELENITRRLHELEVHESETAGNDDRTNQQEEIQEGVRVVISAKDKHRGKTGTVSARKSPQYWFIKLDDGTIIYKMERSFCRISWDEYIL